jgi:type I restriction enzyme S subunit
MGCKRRTSCQQSVEKGNADLKTGQWPKMSVGELADSISETHSFAKAELVFLNTSDILNGKILHHTYSAVKDFPGQAKKSIQRGDILFSEIRPANGRYAFVDIDADDYVVSTKLMVIRGRKSVCAKYLYHFLTSKLITGWLQHLAESRSGTFPQITFDQVASLELGLPPIDSQREIAAFIDTLNDKIDLNRRMNETLEATARGIFKSWFVDFDPVKAKAAGRRPAGMSAGTAALFPNSFECSELGEIPKGWQVATIADLCGVVGGSTPSTKEAAYWEGGRHSWATPKDLSNLVTPVLLKTERRISDQGLRQIGSGKLPAGTVLLSSRAPIGYLAIAEMPVAINQGFIAMLPTNGASNLFLLFWASSAREDILSRANGSTFQEISKSNFRPIPLVRPPATIMQAFDEQVRPLYGLIVDSERESRTLASLRDTLLPQLVSGELGVHDGARIVETGV